MFMNWIGRVFGGNGASGLDFGVPPVRTFDDMASQPSAIVDSDELAAELTRARRYERSLSVVVLSASPLETGSGGPDSSADGASRLPQMIALLTAVALRDLVRESDVVCYQAVENRFVVGLTESDGASAQAALERIRAHFRAHLRLQVRAGMALFPGEAYTLDNLVAIAGDRAGGREAHGHRRRPVGADARRSASNGRARRVGA